jgi:hypothetical protein
MVDGPEGMEYRTRSREGGIVESQCNERGLDIHMAWRLGCWLAGWPVTGGLDTCMDGVPGSWIMYEIVIEILYPLVISGVDFRCRNCTS